MCTGSEAVFAFPAASSAADGITDTVTTSATEADERDTSKEYCLAETSVASSTTPGTTTPPRETEMPSAEKPNTSSSKVARNKRGAVELGDKAVVVRVTVGEVESW
jgi:hypothetical protein